MVSTLMTALVFVLCYLSKGVAIEDHKAVERTYWTCPLPTCSSCPSNRQQQQPGIGFALEMGYGTAAIRWHNGTIQPVIQIQGSASYLELMKSLSHTSYETRFPNIIPTTEGKIAYATGRLQRIANKLFRRPANQQTAVLTEMLGQLKRSVEEALPSGMRTTHAVVVSPDSIYLTAEEIGDTLDYLHVVNLMTELDDLYSASAAYVGLGKGLCKSYTQPYACAKEGDLELSYERVMVVNFSDAALSMTLKGMKAFNAFSADAVLIDSEMGYTDGQSDEETQQLYAKIGTRMRRFAQDHKEKITLILLVGTRVNDVRFQQILKDAMADLMTAEARIEPTSISIEGEDTNSDMIFATAKGAAEIAKRRLEGPVRCKWSEKCQSFQVRRERRREDSLGL